MTIPSAVVYIALAIAELFASPSELTVDYFQENLPGETLYLERMPPIGKPEDPRDLYFLSTEQETVAQIEETDLYANNFLVYFQDSRVPKVADISGFALDGTGLSITSADLDLTPDDEADSAEEGYLLTIDGALIISLPARSLVIVLSGL